MEYPVALKGYEDRLVLVREGWFGNPHLLLDGVPVQNPGPRSPFAFPEENGKQVVGIFRYRFLDPIPQIQVGKEVISVVPPLKWFEWVFICLPFIVVLLDPLVGALIGAISATVNARVFRSDLSRKAKFIAAGLIALAGVGLYALIYEAAALLIKNR